MDIARPFGVKYLKQKFNLKNSVEDLAWQTLQTAKELPTVPQKLNQLLDIMNANQARLTLKLKDQNKILYRLDQIVNRIMVTIILAAVSSAHQCLFREATETPPSITLE